MPNFYKSYQKRSAGPLRQAGSTDMTISTENQDRLAELRSSIDALESIGQTAISRGVAGEVAEERKASAAEVAEQKALKSANTNKAKKSLGGITTEVNKVIQDKYGDAFRLKTVKEQQTIYSEEFKASVDSRKDPNNSEFNNELQRVGTTIEPNSFSAVTKYNQKLLEKDSKQDMTNIASESFKKTGYDPKAALRELETSLEDTGNVVGAKAAKEAALAGFYQEALGSTEAYNGLMDSGLMKTFPESAKAIRVLKNANDARYQKEQTLAYQSAGNAVESLKRNPTILTNADAKQSVDGIVKRLKITDKNKIITLKAKAQKQVERSNRVNGYLKDVKLGNVKGDFVTMTKDDSKEFFRQANGGISEADITFAGLGANIQGGVVQKGMNPELKMLLDYQKSYKKNSDAFVKFMGTPISNGSVDELANKYGIIKDGLSYNAEAIYQTVDGKTLNKLQLYGQLVNDANYIGKDGQPDPKALATALDTYDKAVKGNFNGVTKFSDVNAYLKEGGKDDNIIKGFTEIATAGGFGENIGINQNTQTLQSYYLQGIASGNTQEEAVKFAEDHFEKNYTKVEFSTGNQSMMDHKWAPNLRENLVNYMKAKGYENPEEYDMVPSEDALLTQGNTAIIKLGGVNKLKIDLNEFHNTLNFYGKQVSVEASEEATTKRKSYQRMQKVIWNSIEQQSKYDL